MPVGSEVCGLSAHGGEGRKLRGEDPAARFFNFVCGDAVCSNFLHHFENCLDGLIPGFRFALGAHDEKARETRRVGVGVDSVDELEFLAHPAIEP